MPYANRVIVGFFVLSTANIGLASTSGTNSESNQSAFSGMVKMHHVMDAKENGYDPSSGQAFLVNLNYDSPRIYGIQLGMGFYASGDIFEQTDDHASREARGLFVNEERSTQANLGEIYLDYRLDNLGLYGGRKIYQSPLTSSSETTIPDFHTLIGANYKPSSLFGLGVSHMSQVSQGARSATEFGLIGEGTGTAGTNVSPKVVDQAKFHSISKAVLGPNAEDTSGLTILNASFNPSDRMNFSAWDYYAHDIFNAVYLEGNHMTPIAGKQFKLSGQYLSQIEIGDKLAGEIDFSMVGLKAALGSKKWGAYIAMNQSSGDTGMFNALSGDPGYTSSQFSRNEYRENVNAYKIGAHYTISPKWVIKGGYANYGQSDTVTKTDIPNVVNTSQAESLSDAYELDFSLIWKPINKTIFKVTHAQRVSEFDDINGKELQQEHTRFIGEYRF